MCSGAGLESEASGWELKQENHNFKALLGNLMRLYLKIKYLKRGCSSVVRHLPSKCEALSSITNTAKNSGGGWGK